MFSELKFVLPNPAFAPPPSLWTRSAGVKLVCVANKESGLWAALFFWGRDDLTAAARA